MKTISSIFSDQNASIYALYELKFETVTNESLGVLYASTKAVQNPKKRLNAAITHLLSTSSGVQASSDAAATDVKPEVLFELYYDQSRDSSSNEVTASTCVFPSSSLDLAFDDSILDNIEEAWRLVGSKTDFAETEQTPYMTFKSREQFGDDDE